MAFTAGTSAIHLQNIENIEITSGLNVIDVIGDNILDGVVITPSIGTTTRVASGRDRVSSEKLLVEFIVIEGTSADITKLLNMKNTVTSLVIDLDADVDNLNIQVSGILQVLRMVTTNTNIQYKVTMEINAKDIDTELTRA
jgi:hypothetical protein